MCDFTKIPLIPAHKIEFIEKLKAKFKKRAPSDCKEFILVLVLEKNICL